VITILYHLKEDDKTIIALNAIRKKACIVGEQTSQGKTKIKTLSLIKETAATAYMLRKALS
jgi:hypothetical protein